MPRLIQGFCPSSKHCWLGDPPGTFLTNWEAKVSSRIKRCLSRETFLGKVCGLVLFELEEEGKEKEWIELFSRSGYGSEV